MELDKPANEGGCPVDRDKARAWREQWEREYAHRWRTLPSGCLVPRDPYHNPASAPCVPGRDRCQWFLIVVKRAS